MFCVKPSYTIIFNSEVTYDYKNCGVFYEHSVGSPLGNNGLFSIDSWGDAMTVMRGIPPDRFFQNNDCKLTGKVEEK